MRSRARLASLAVLLLLAAGCTEDGPGPPATLPGPEPPQPFRAASGPPDGWKVTQCSDLRSRSNSGLATRFGVPPALNWVYRDGRSCDFEAGYNRSLYVELEPQTTLLEKKLRDVDPYTAPDQGDGQLGEVGYAANVPVFGMLNGERLRYYCFCDGQQLDYLVLQANGVRLTWITPHGRSRRARELGGVTDTLALLRSDRSICSTRRSTRSASYVPPIPQTESIDGYGNGCHLYLQPGRGSLERYAEVVPDPRRTLEQLGEGLERQRRISDVTVEDGRLTWTFNGRSKTWRGVTVERDGVQITWSATPQQWRQEADAYRTFVRSVRLLSR